MDRLTEKERIEILMILGYGDMRRSPQETCNIFNNLYPNRNPITRSTVSKLLRKFNQTGAVKDLPKSGRRKTASNENKSLDVCVMLEDDPHLSTRQISRELDISQRSVMRILRNNKFHPYKVRLVQELSDDDFDRREEFADIMMRKCYDPNDPNFLENVMFSDEATFLINGHVNRHNSRYWSRNNPHWMRESHTQHPEKLNVWAGIIGNKIIGLFFIEGNLNGPAYLHLLENSIIPELARLFPNQDNNNIPNNIWLQQDGAPPHYAREVRQYLNNVFPRRWIGRRGYIEWPPRSPDMNPLDYFLWGHLKNIVYKTKPLDIQELKDRITTEIRRIEQSGMLQNVLQSFKNRMACCIEVNGQHFEHLL